MKDYDYSEVGKMQLVDIPVETGCVARTDGKLQMSRKRLNPFNEVHAQIYRKGTPRARRIRGSRQLFCNPPNHGAKGDPMYKDFCFALVFNVGKVL